MIKWKYLRRSPSIKIHQSLHKKATKQAWRFKSVPSLLFNGTSKGSNSLSITCNPLTFAELEQILYNIKLEMVDKVGDPPGSTFRIRSHDGLQSVHRHSKRYNRIEVLHLVHVNKAGAMFLIHLEPCWSRFGGSVAVLSLQTDMNCYRNSQNICRKKIRLVEYSKKTRGTWIFCFSRFDLGLDWAVAG